MGQSAQPGGDLPGGADLAPFGPLVGAVPLTFLRRDPTADAELLAWARAQRPRIDRLIDIVVGACVGLILARAAVALFERGGL